MKLQKQATDLNKDQAVVRNRAITQMVQHDAKNQLHNLLNVTRDSENKRAGRTTQVGKPITMMESMRLALMSKVSQLEKIDAIEAFR